VSKLFKNSQQTHNVPAVSEQNMVTKIFLFSSSLIIHSLHFPFLMPLRLTLMIFLMPFSFTHNSKTRKQSYWCMEGKITTGTNESRTRTSYRGCPQSQSPLRHRSPNAHPPRTTQQESQPSSPQRSPLQAHRPV